MLVTITVYVVKKTSSIYEQTKILPSLLIHSHTYYTGMHHANVDQNLIEDQCNFMDKYFQNRVEN